MSISVSILPAYESTQLLQGLYIQSLRVEQFSILRVCTLVRVEVELTSNAISYLNDVGSFCFHEISRLPAAWLLPRYHCTLSSV